MIAVSVLSLRARRTFENDERRMRVTGDSTRQHDYNGGVEYDGRAMTDGGMMTVTETVRLRLVSGFSSRRTVTSSSSVSVSDPIVHYFFRSMQLEHTHTQSLVGRCAHKKAWIYCVHHSATLLDLPVTVG